MEGPLNLEIVSPENVIFNGNIEMVELPGKNGRFAILRNHAPIIASLGTGDIHIKTDKGDEKSFPCQSGYVECKQNKVSVLLSA